MSGDLFGAKNGDKTTALVEDLSRFVSHGLKTANARKCFRCKAFAPFGFVRGDYNGTLWACRTHRGDLR